MADAGTIEAAEFETRFFHSGTSYVPVLSTVPLQPEEQPVGSPKLCKPSVVLLDPHIGR